MKYQIWCREFELEKTTVDAENAEQAVYAWTHDHELILDGVEHDIYMLDGSGLLRIFIFCSHGDFLKEIGA